MNDDAFIVQGWMLYPVVVAALILFVAYKYFWFFVKARFALSALRALFPLLIVLGVVLYVAG